MPSRVRHRQAVALVVASGFTVAFASACTANNPKSSSTVTVTAQAPTSDAPTSAATVPATPAAATTPAPATAPNYAGQNLANAITAAKSAGLSVSDVGGGTLGIIDTSNWTVCFSTTTGKATTMFAAKDCSPDSNSQTGSKVSPGAVASFSGQNLQTVEKSLQSAGHGYDEIGGGALGIVLPADWTVCYTSINAAGTAQLFAAKNCTSSPAN